MFVTYYYNYHKHIDELLLSFCLRPSIHWLYVSLRLRRAVKQHQVKIFIIFLVPIIYTLVIIIKLALPILLGYPVFQVRSFLCICAGWGLHFLHGFYSIHTIVFVEHCIIIFQIILYFQKPGCILADLILIYTLSSPVVVEVEVDFLGFLGPGFLFLWAVAPSNFTFFSSVVCPCWLLVPFKAYSTTCGNGASKHLFL